jgi:hypothetical protein
MAGGGCHLVPGHGHEQAEDLIGTLEIILPRGGADEEAGHHRLADIHRIEHADQAGVLELEPNLPAHQRLVAAHQLSGGPIVAGADPSNQLGNRSFIGHDGRSPG